MRTIALVVMLGFGGGCATLSSSSGSTAGDSKNQIDLPVQSPPPPEKVEAARPAAPGFGYIWVAGYWDYLDGNYIWREGRWVQGKPDYEYVRARYDNEAGKGWVFHRPHWKKRQHSGEQASKPAT